MELDHPAAALTDALADALGHRLPDIEYEFRTPMERRDGYPASLRTRRPDMGDIEVRLFPETWPSTALGFGGLGGAAMTPAYTVVISTQRISLVYWAGRFAYAVRQTEQFLTDLNAGRTYDREAARSRYKIDSEIKQ